jgi:competence protein ComFC
VKRLRERGFNQAILLSKKWAKLENLPLDAFALLRTRWTEPQTSLSRKERKRNITGAFAVKKPERGKDSLGGRRIHHRVDS